MAGNVREFEEYEDDSVQRAPKLHDNPYYKKAIRKEERTEKKQSRSKTRNMPVDIPDTDEELYGYSYR